MTHPTRSVNGQKSAATRRNRTKAGRYPTNEQRLAMLAYLSEGAKYLNREALLLLSEHPYLLESQKSAFLEKALAAAE